MKKITCVAVFLLCLLSCSVCFCNNDTREITGGFGGVVFGLSPEEVSEICGDPIDTRDESRPGFTVPILTHCIYKNGIEVYFEEYNEGLLARRIVCSNPKFKTVSGICVGMNIKRAKNIVSRIRINKNKGDGGKIPINMRWAQLLGDGCEMIFLMNDKGNIRSMFVDVFED